MYCIYVDIYFKTWMIAGSLDEIHIYIYTYDID